MNPPTAIRIVIAGDGSVAAVSGGTEAVFGQVASALLGVSVSTLFADAAGLGCPDMNERGFTVLAQARHVRGDLTLVEVEAVAILAREGMETLLTIRPTGAGGSPSTLVSDAGGPAAIAAPHHLGEELFRSMYEHSAAGMAVCDLTGRYISVNAAMCEFLGYSEAELLARTFIDVTYPDDVDFNVDQRTALLENSCDAIQLEKRYVRKDGRVVWGLTVVSLVRDHRGCPLYTLGQMLNIDRLKQTESELKQSRQQIQKLVSHNNLVVEAERKRIAGEVHDEVGQLLTVLKIDMQLCQASLTDDMALKRKSQTMLELIERTIQSARTIAHHLRPPALNLGLIPAMEWLVEEVAARTRLRVYLQAPPLERKLDDATATAVFRITQESLTNVIRHAAATEVYLTLALVRGVLWLQIRDNGRGFLVDRAFRCGGFGLLGLRERVLALDGQLEIESEPGAGTTIDIEVPIRP